MKENLDTKEALHRLESSQELRKENQEQIQCLECDKMMYNYALTFFNRRNSEKLLVNIIGGFQGIFLPLLFSIGSIITQNISGAIAFASLAAVWSLGMHIVNKKVLRENINTCLVLLLNKEPLDRNIKVNKKTKEKFINDINRERKLVQEEIYQLMDSNVRLRSEIQLYEDKLSEDCRKIAASEQKRTPTSNLDIRTQNILFHQKAEPMIDDSNVKPIQFVKRK